MIMPCLRRSDTGRQPFDPTLVARCLKGNEDAWESIVLSFSGRIFGMSLHYTGRREEAEDLTQEIFIRIYQKLESFRAENGSFATWALTLSRNVIIDHFRKTRRFQSHGGTPELEKVQISDEATPSPQRKIEQEETSRVLAEVLRALSPETREAVILRDLQGMGYREMVTVLGVPEGTVKSRLNRGRLALAQGLARHPARREIHV